MRTLLPLFAVMCLLTFASRGYGEFDGIGEATLKLRATRATFASEIATKQPARGNPLCDLPKSTFPWVGLGLVDAPLVRGMTGGNDYLIDLGNWPAPIRTPRTHRSANIPSLPYLLVPHGWY